MVIRRLFSRVKKPKKTARRAIKPKAGRATRGRAKMRPARPAKAGRAVKKAAKGRATMRAVKRARPKALRRVKAKKVRKAARRFKKPVTKAKRVTKARKPAVKRIKAKVAVSRPARPAEQTLPTAKEVGRVTHYFDNISVAVVDLSSTLRQGDQIHIRGHTTNVKQRAASMQVNHMPVSVAQAGESIGLKVSGRVREGDRVFRLG